MKDDNKFKLMMLYQQYFPELSTRELQVFLLSAAGYKITQIPKILKECLNQNVALTTLYGYIERIKDKLEISEITRDASFLLINRIILFGKPFN